MSVSKPRLPSLDLIHSFVTVGRRMSITLAAEELCVTQSAVSRQIHALEAALGVTLLVRGHRSIAFTSDGEQLFELADHALLELQTWVEKLGTAQARRPVTVSMPAGFAGLWLLPRMSDFQRRHPDINLRISAVARLVNLRHEGIDLAIRYSRASSAPDGALRLFDETIAPVAHPSLCRQALKSGEQLSDHVLLEFDEPRRAHLQWDAWHKFMGWTHGTPKGVLRFNHYDQLIQAALAGQGIALGRLELLTTMIAEGQLVVLSPARRVVKSKYAHWLIQADPEPRQEVREVVAWIAAQVAAMDETIG